MTAIVVAVAAVYSNALRASFQFDDWNVIVNQPRVGSLAAWWASMPGIRPLLKLSYALQNNFAAGPAAFHAANVAIHAANALLAYALVVRLAGREGMDRLLSRRVALLGALLFALHPVQTEAVTYVSGRSTSLAALLSLASIVCWIEGRNRERLILAGSSAVLLAAALLVKEIALVVPFVIVLWEASSGRRHAPHAPRIPWAHFAILGTAAVAALASATYRHLLATSLGIRGIGSAVLTQAHAVVYLIGQLVRFDRLNADPVLPVFDHWNPTVALEAAALVGLLALGIKLLRTLPSVAFGILWFFAWLAPTNSVIPRLNVANERQLYVALLGPAWLVALAAGRGLSNRSASAWIAATLVIAVPLGITTHARNRVYANEIAFWSDVTRKAPDNPRAFNNLGYAYALAARNADAARAFEAALAIDPDDVRAAVNLRLLREGALARRPQGP